MKLITYTYQGASTWGAVVGDGVIELGSRLPAVAGVAGLLGAGTATFAAARSLLEQTPADYPQSAVALLRPVPHPRRSSASA
ncbi:hypothetical protein [Pseudomonas sp. KNUC1026]|uniref:hypothetical protein n=1 Tax=Pseudomonas sp. KNUC1026 TaxID=2893890 RepID=UPI001F311E9A|nr:hypothetical protein [Pseudomonas sp. KNUC1026]UFH51203.1 hypothetical protein LN139_09290 [Pseudomonas sp. KNUC1026]